ncbi:MAG: biotin--[acetyl-CoA-carboxylase] ligase [Bacteroidales bacterium]|nr:biotin--[acetyl-CoA-carboxylase] ligase [Bacteroidales bacterium]
MKLNTNIIYREKVSSTNNLATSLFTAGEAGEGTVIYAGFQSEGKGQKGNQWESEPGMNLTMSIILTPAFLEADKQFLISKVVSLALIDTVNQFTKGSSIKWPNDIYILNDKIAGILIENIVSGNILSASIAGIGLNINQEIFTSDAPNPVSLKQITGINYDINELCHTMCNNLERRYNMLKAGAVSEIDSDYLASLYRLEEISFFSSKGRRFRGIIKGVDDYGQLIIENIRGKIKIFSFKEVEFIL